MLISSILNFFNNFGLLVVSFYLPIFLGSGVLNSVLIDIYNTSLTMAGGVEAASGRNKRKNNLLRKQLAVALRSVQWSYAIFWSSSLTQPG